MEGRTAGDLFLKASEALYGVGGWLLLSGIAMLFVVIMYEIIRIKNRTNSHDGGNHESEN